MWINSKEQGLSQNIFRNVLQNTFENSSKNDFKHSLLNRNSLENRLKPI